MARSDTATASASTSAPTAEGPAMVVCVRSNRGNITIPIPDEKWRVTGELLLFAGPNMVPADKWEAAKRQPMVAVLMREKIKSIKAQEQEQRLVGRYVLEVVGKPVPAAAPLSGLDETAACELVKDVADQAMLGGLLRGESRGPVRRAIQARIDELKDPSKLATAAQAAAGERGQASITLE